MKRQPPKIPRPTPVPRVPGPLDTATMTPVEAAAFWAGEGAVQPIVAAQADGTCLVTFCWQGPEADSVLLFANRLTDETDLPATLLSRVEGTDIFHATYRMDPDWRASYSFLVQEHGAPAPWRSGDQVQIRQVLDQGSPDPRNPVACWNRAGVRQSVVQLPQAPAQPWLTPDPSGVEAPAGDLSDHVLDDGRTVWLYDPAGSAPQDLLPLLVMMDGEVWTRPEQGLLRSVDRMIAAGVVAPIRIAFPESGGRDARWKELAADGSGVSDLVDGLVPWVRQRRGVLDSPAAVAFAGQSLGGLTALRAGLLRPDVVGAVISHSASLWQDDVREIIGPVLPRIYLAHGRQEWVLTGPHDDLAVALARHGADLAVSTHNGGHDYAWWRGGVAEGLQWWAGTAD